MTQALARMTSSPPTNHLTVTFPQVTNLRRTHHTGGGATVKPGR